MRKWGRKMTVEVVVAAERGTLGWTNMAFAGVQSLLLRSVHYRMHAERLLCASKDPALGDSGTTAPTRPHLGWGEVLRGGCRKRRNREPPQSA